MTFDLYPEDISLYSTYNYIVLDDDRSRLIQYYYFFCYDSSSTLNFDDDTPTTLCVT